jgi:hypothetical protein
MDENKFHWMKVEIILMKLDQMRMKDRLLHLDEI